MRNQGAVKGNSKLGFAVVLYVVIGVLVSGCGQDQALSGSSSAAIMASNGTGAASNQMAHDISISPREVVDEYCTTCHNFEDYAGGLDLESFDFSQIGTQAETGEKIVRKLRAGVMPPPGKPRPDLGTHDLLVSSLEGSLDAAAASSPVLIPPGAHRMNRQEYANSIRDLLSLEIDPGALLPVDDTSYGFDNMAGSLGSSPALVEAYVLAAAKISRLALGHEVGPTQKNYLAPADYSQTRQVEGLAFGTRGGLRVEHYFPADGTYLFNWTPVKTNAGGLFGDPEGEFLELTIDGERIKLYDVNEVLTGNRKNEGLDVEVPVKAGLRTVGLAFISTTHVPNGDINQHYERTTLTQNVRGYKFRVHVNSLSIAGPFNGMRPEYTPSREKVFNCTPTNASEEAACAETILSSLATKAFRRPITETELGTLLSFYEAGRNEGDFEVGIERGLQLILSDPKFIYRTEGVQDTTTDNSYLVSELELASRLSYFLWSSVPDDELRTAAAEGRLRAPGVLEQQVKRMLVDSRSQSLVTNFAGQWLQLRNLQSSAPASTLFPDFDDNLRQAFRTETEMFFESIMREDRNVVDLLDANYTFLDERLAKHYGIPDVYGSQFRRVELSPEFDMRRGLLGKGSILTVSSVADRTSPVLRGKWVLLNILGVIPPDPPPNIPALASNEGKSKGDQAFTMRQRMDQHRANPACTSCHQMMDPIGFALDAFDGIGQYRTAEFGQTLNLSGELVDGSEFVGPSELREALMQYAPQFVHTMTERLLTYALGRGVQYYDMPVVRDIVRKAEEEDNRFSALVLGIVESQPFQRNQLVGDTLTAEL